MKFIKIIIILSFFLQFTLPNNPNFKTRVSFLNFGLDYTKYSSMNELYRSIFLIPIMLEKKNFEIGLYLSPFIKEKYDNFENYEYDGNCSS